MQRKVLSVFGNVSKLLAISTFLFACQNDDNLSPEESKVKSETAANDNSEILAVTQEVLDVTSMALLEKGVTNGRTSSGGRLNEHGFNCYPTISASYDVKKTADSLVYTGNITIDFGDGYSCEDSTKVRSGKIMDVFKYVIAYKDSVPFTSNEIISFDHFKKDSVELDGTFTSSFAGGSYTVDINDAMLTYADGTSVNWGGVLVYQYDSHGTTNWKDDTKTLTGSINGTTRLADVFTADITEEIHFSYKCEGKHDVPVSGTVKINTAGNEAEINYGDGTCDKIYVITTNGEMTEYTFGRKHS